MTKLRQDVFVDNEIRSFRTEKKSLIGKSGKVIGVFGFAVDITAEKEAQRLKLENERRQIVLLEEQEKLIALAHAVAHDISSPLSALKMIIPLCNGLPENKRALLNRATESILDIANNLLSTYRTQNPTVSDIEPRQPLLISDQLVHLISEKRAQYQQRLVSLKR